MNDDKQFDRGYQRPTRSWYYEIPKLGYQGLLTGSSATLYTAPAAPTTVPTPKARLDEIVLCNTDTSARTVTLYMVVSGGSVGDSNTLLSAFSIEPKTTLVLPMRTMMELGATIRGLADTANKVSIRLSVTELLTIGTF